MSDAPALTVMRWRWRHRGAFVVVQVFTGPEGRNQDQFTACGDLIIAAAAWPDILALLAPRVEVIGDEG